MFGSPGNPLQKLWRRVRDRSHLKPAEENVEIWQLRSENEAIGAESRLSEPAEEKKQISDTHSLILQVFLRRSGLTEDRPPTLWSRYCICSQVRIEVTRCRRRDLAPR